MSKNKSTRNRNIPLPVKRKVRQRCGFGCVICGSPIYQYHHIKDWSEGGEDKADNITLLCPNHHAKATKNLIPKGEILQSNKNPKNILRGKSNPELLYYEGDKCKVNLGGNHFITKRNSGLTEMIPLLIDGVPLIKFVLKENNLFLNMRVFNKFNNLVLRIDENELFYSINPWDIEYQGTTLTVREKKGKFLIQMEFNPPDEITISKGKFLFNGVEILIEEDHFVVNNGSQIAGNEMRDCHAGLIIGKTPMPISGAVKIEDVDRT